MTESFSHWKTMINRGIQTEIYEKLSPHWPLKPNIVQKIRQFMASPLARTSILTWPFENNDCPQNLAPVCLLLKLEHGFATNPWTTSFGKRWFPEIGIVGHSMSSHMQTTLVLNLLQLSLMRIKLICSWWMHPIDSKITEVNIYFQMI